MASPEINEIMSGPLVQWFVSCLDDPHTLTDYNDLVDGVLLHRVFLQIDPEPLHDRVEPTCGKAAQRVKNLETVVANIKQFYDGQLGHLMLRQPDTTNLGREPEAHLPDAQLLLLLLLGCAVQCENKELFITRIKSLNLETQLALVDCIKQVTDQCDIVITEDALVAASGSVVFGQFKYLLQERDLYREKWKASTLSDMFEAEDENENSYDKAKCKLERETNRHLAVELADWKSKMRKQRQKLDEKTEALLECKEELEHCKVSLAKLKQENQELLQAARTVQSYKDELDAVIERADRADRLELEVQRYREKLTDMEFYKTRIEELREDNRVLIENREMLEEQLRSSRRNTEKLLELQTQIIEYEKLIDEMTLEHAANKEKYEELLEENCELSRLKKAAEDEVALAGLANENEEPATADSSLSEQLTNNAQTRALKLELENRRLMTIIDSLEENWYNETTSRVIELQRGKNKFSSSFDAPSNDKANLSHHNCDLELVCKEALEENKKLQNILKNQRNSFERQAEEYEAQRNKIAKLDNSYEAVTKEKKKMQLLLESARRRADDLDKSLEVSNQQLEELNGTRLRAKKSEAKCNELETALAVSEKEKEYSLRDNKKCRRIIEVKDIALDKSTDRVEVLEKRVAQFKEEIKNLVTEVTRLQGIEKSYEELNSRVTSDREALENLESSLVAEKLNSQQFYEIFGKLGLDVQSTLTTLSLDNILERISNIPEVIDLVKRTIVGEVKRDGTRAEAESDGSVYVASVTKNLQDIIDSQKKEIESLLTKTRVIQATADHLKCEKMKLGVSLTTLQSQSTSRTSQRAARQLTNSQLIAEKEELLKDCLANERAHFQVVNDQATLQTLHEQLNREYENILHERETLKANLRDAKNTVRTLRETCRRLETEKKLLNAGKKTAIANVNCLSNLRLEHSKLEEDFINLYTSTDQLKAEYANLQENYARNKAEMNRLSLQQTAMQGELSASNDKCAAMELEINKLNQTSKMLLQVNSGLESNRKSLMTHLSLLFTQYHELLTHSFEDKEHYHTEEKLYTDKVNHLYRQKEKLEEKIMDHYRKMESCSAKKKKFGANLVRRVRKAGSELLSMNRRSWADDSSKQSENGKTYEFESGENDSDASSDDKRAAEPVQLPELNDKISRWVIQEP